MRKKIILFVSVAILGACGGGGKQKADLVDPFIGTDAHGHTFPGATTPFGLVQVSPDTGVEGWDWCSGYHSSDNSIIGFSHSHLSGTGGADLGDILLMPSSGEIKFVPGDKNDPNSGYRSSFKQKSEYAHAGFYKVTLDDNKVGVELTATPHAAVHKYEFEGDNKHIILDLKHGIADNVKEGKIFQISPNVITGYRISNGWADQHTVYYYIEFSEPIKKIVSMVDGVKNETGVATGKEVVSAIIFEDGTNSLIEVKVGISYVDMEGAMLNLQQEIGDRSFDQVHQMARESWNKHLGKIEVKGGTDDDQKIFYTALYHSMIAPYNMSDVDGRYLGSDNAIYLDTTVTNYGLFSLWDTFRALHPLMTIIEPKKNQQFIQSMLRYYKQSGRLPVWDLNMRENNCMIGYHSVPVIVDAYMKGQRDFDANLAMEAMLHSAMQDQYGGLKYYRHYGYLPMDKENNAVSKAVEYAYDDWCIAMMAKEMGNKEVYDQYIKRAQYYKNQVDSKDGFMKGRDSHGKFRENFDPNDISILGQGDFTEGNSWHYSFFVPQDVNSHIKILGGDEKYVAKLDEMFNSKSATNDHSPDVSGLIGNYAQGNEPSHHAAYLYAYAGQPWKTQEMIAKIKKEFYTSQRDGLCGNEDCGQMSAWYLFSAMGFYPVTPGSNVYVMGTPTFDEITINNDNGTKFKVVAKGVSPKNIYIQSATFDGKPYTKSYITHEMIVKGGELVLVMGESPNKEFGAAIEDRPVSVIEEAISSDEMLKGVVFEPFIDTKVRVFDQNIEVMISTVNDGAQVAFTVNGKEPDKNSTKSSGKIKIDADKVLKIKALANGNMSTTGEYKFYKGLVESPVTGTQPDEPYVGKGLSALNDGFMGGDEYKNPNWIGYNGKVATLETKFEPKNIKRVGFNAINAPGAWIVLPFGAKATLFFNGKQVAQETYNIPDSKTVDNGAHYFGVHFNDIKADKVVLEIEGGKLPQWHASQGKDAWMFIDEIMVY